MYIQSKNWNNLSGTINSDETGEQGVGDFTEKDTTISLNEKRSDTEMVL